VALGEERDAPAEIAGPAVVALPESTLLVPAGWRGGADATGTIHLHREDA
jgi:N-methylhydantoinase A